MEARVQFDKWWARSVGAFVLIFMGWFIIREADGWQPLVDLVIGAIVYIPRALQDVLTYYGDVPTEALLGSIIIGGMFGSLTTGFVYLTATKTITVPPVRSLVYGVAMLAIMIALLEQINVFIALFFGVVVFLAGAALQADFRHFVRQDLRPILRSRQEQKLILTGVVVGGIVGALGAQTLNLATQHCTLYADADSTTRQIGIFLTVISTFVLLVPVWSLIGRRASRRTESQSGFFGSRILPLILLSPTLISLLVFLYYPSVQIASQSLTRTLGRARNVTPQFACMDNYINLANDAIYQNSFLITFTLTVAIVSLSMIFALLIAVLASQNIRGANIYRTLLIWPYALSPVVTGVIFISMFRDDNSGLINYMLETAGGTSVNWLTEASIAPWVVIAAAIYNILGFNIIFYIAGLQNIPKDLLEAAQIDGASVVQRFIRITIPLLSPYTFFLLVANITYSFYGIFGVIDTLFPNGGPPLPDGQGNAVEVLIFKLYDDAFRSGAQIGETGAQSMILFALVAAITIIQFRVIETRVTYAD